MILGNLFYVILKNKNTGHTTDKIVCAEKKELCPCGNDKKTNRVSNRPKANCPGKNFTHI